MRRSGTARLASAWGVVVDGFRPDHWDLVGAAIYPDPDRAGLASANSLRVSPAFTVTVTIGGRRIAFAWAMTRLTRASRVAGGQGSLRRLTLLMSACTSTVLQFHDRAVAVDVGGGGRTPGTGPVGVVPLLHLSGAPAQMFYLDASSLASDMQDAVSIDRSDPASFRGRGSARLRPAGRADPRSPLRQPDRCSATASGQVVSREVAPRASRPQPPTRCLPLIPPALTARCQAGAPGTDR